VWIFQLSGEGKGSVGGGGGLVQPKIKETMMVATGRLCLGNK